jgi:hypothetical protein
VSTCIPIGEISVAAGTPLPPRDPDDYYRTPVYTIRSTYNKLFELMPALNDQRSRLSILDPGAGDGCWGEVARDIWPEAKICGVERRPVSPHNCYNEWLVGDYPEVGGQDRMFDLIIGNPPFKYCQQFISAGLNQLEYGGFLVFLLRLGFAGGQRRRDGLFTKNPPRLVAVCSKRPSFSGDGRTKPIEYAMFFWQRGYKGATTLDWLTEK